VALEVEIKSLLRELHLRADTLLKETDESNSCKV
jgi:hypothetical protein